MKKSKLIFKLISITSIVLFTACQTTPKSDRQNKNHDEDGNEIEFSDNKTPDKVIKEPRPITVQNTSNQKENEFKEMLSTLTLKVISTPSAKKTVYTGSAFTTPYVIEATNDDGPVKDLDITISWPVSRVNDTITYATAQMKTNDEGLMTYLPGAPSIAVKDKITFYPSPVSSSSKIVQLSYNAGVSAPYIVQSRYTTYPGGILFIYDFNEKGNPTVNNFTLLQYLRKIGINAGNAPISDAEYLNKSPSDIYNACIEITQGEIKKAANFLIIGSFKYVNPISNENGNYTCTMKAEISCIDMKNGSVIYKTSVTETATESDGRTAENKCKSLIAEKLGDSIIYGM